MRARTGAAIVALATIAAGMTAGTGARAACVPVARAAPSPAFEAPALLDDTRAGGEPVVLALPDGDVLYASHAGATHLSRPRLPDTDFVTPYNGAVYLWRSPDGGGTWSYVGLAGTASGPHATVSGFSDPTLAVDAAGTAYVSGINLANIYVARSVDPERSVWAGHPFATFVTDRQWLAADEPGVVYLNGNSFAEGRTLWKSRDAGLTWSVHRGIPLWGSGPPSPIAIDQSDGRLYFPADSSVQVMPNARADDFTSSGAIVPGGLPRAFGFINSIAIDAGGTVYVASNTARDVRVSWSADRGASWRTATVARTPGAVLWPWVAAAAPGRVGVAWLQSDAPVSNPQYQGASYRVWAAVTDTGAGWTDSCGEARAPIWSTPVAATPDPVHEGTICTGGLQCFGSERDRRLGDYISASMTPDGRLLIAYGNTTAKPNGAISHPALVREAR